MASGLITAIEGVGDPYADGYGAREQSDPWDGVEDALLDQESEERLCPVEGAMTIVVEGAAGNGSTLVISL